MALMPDMDRHVLVTGGAGYIGSSLVGELLKRGYFVTVVDKLLAGGDSLLGYFIDPKFVFLRGDVCQMGTIMQAAREALQQGAPPLYAVIHLAAIAGFPACKVWGADQSWLQNVEAVRAVYEQAVKLGAERFLFSSTYSVYGYSPDGHEVREDSQLFPQSLYAETKIAAEQFLQTQANDAICFPLIFRFATLYGPSARMRFDLMVNQFVLEAFAQKQLVIYQKSYSRSFVHIGDVIRGLILGLELPKERITSNLFNLGDEGSNHTKQEIVSLICDQLPEVRIFYDDRSCNGDMRDIRVSFRRIHEELGFVVSHGVEEGITQVLQLVRSGAIAEKYRNVPLAVQ
jgi:nucleoside-diphosphate-sugar epimerase